MKKLLSLTFAAIMLAAVLASCASAPSVSLNANVRVTSSDAIDAAAWLSSRLGDKLADRTVVIGTKADDYGVDVDTLEEDGYLIRSFGREDVLLAKTPEGLECAARRYAKAVERGDKAIDATYHDGARIEKLTIADNDISQYSIFSEYTLSENDRVKTYHRVTDEIVPAFVDLLEYACGVRIAVADESAAHRIVFRRVVDATWDESDFRYYVSGGDLIFEYSMLLGAKYGMAAFFEDELGWRDVDFGFDYLPEADAINVPEGTDHAVKPLFARGYDSRDNGYVGNTGLNTLARSTRSIYNFRSEIPKSGHGMQYMRWADRDDVQWFQICYTDEVKREICVNNILKYISDRLDAKDVIGDTLTMIDCGQGDNLNYCHCAKCKKVMAQENNSEAGPVVRWMNSVEEEIDAEGYDGLIYTCFAYHGSNKPCKTRPNDDIYITFCLDGNCSRHLLDGSQCQWESFDMAGAWGQGVHLNNRDFIGWIKGWGELTENLYVWYYALDNNLYTYSLMDTLYDDIKLLSDLNVAQVHMESESIGLGFSFMINELAMRFTLHPDMTREEFNDAYFDVLELTYGDGWRNVAEAIAFMDECEMRVKSCRNCWGYVNFCSYDNLDYEYYLTRWDEMCERFDEAIAEANTPWQVGMCEKMSTHFIYSGLYAAYFPAYEADDAEMMSLIEERWATVCERLRKNGYDPFDNISVHFELDETIHEFAWNNWEWTRASFFPAGTELKPVPAEYVIVDEE